MKNMVHFYDSCKSNKFAQTQRRYTRITNRKQISIFRHYLSKNGSKQHKYSEIKNYALTKYSSIKKEKFRHARAQTIPVHDMDLKMLAHSKAKVLEIPQCQISDTFILRLKRLNNTFSRKNYKIHDYITSTKF